MSGKNNVNKDHYTQAGRDRPNQSSLPNENKEALTRAQKRVATGEAAAPKGESPKVQPANTGLHDDRPASKQEQEDQKENDR